VNSLRRSTSASTADGDTPPRSLGALVAPGLLVAATGVGAGDLVTASLAGSRVGLVVIWAALLGGLLKWTINEGTIRWQLATGRSLLDGWWTHLGRTFGWLFLGYFLLWSFAVGGALVTACGIAATALFPLGSAEQSKIIWGIAHSLVGLAVVRVGGFRLFARVMQVVVIAMFVAVIATAALLVLRDPASVFSAAARPTLPQSAAEWRWFLAVLGGVGGTVTMLSYGYWVRETGREGLRGLRSSRIDLAVSYTLTAAFGVAMVVIGSRIPGEGSGARVAIELAEQLRATLGPGAGTLFLLGFWGAVFSSLLGVWQSAPYLFADCWRLRGRALTQHSAPLAAAVTTAQGTALPLRESAAYRWYLLAIATVPLLLLVTTVQQVQLAYALLGAWFMPLVALTLLVMNTRTAWVGHDFRNGWGINLLLAGTVALFTFLAAIGIRD
jgi:Mn2+/Fe2+ NRAMP family transporter